MTLPIDAQTAIESRMKDNFDAEWASQPAVKVVWENIKSKEPTPPYIKFYVRHYDSQLVGIGGPVHLRRHYGRIECQVFVELGIGVKQARRIGQAILSVFEGQKFNGITCRDGYLTEVGVDGNLYQCNVRILFDYDKPVVVG